MPIDQKELARRLKLAREACHLTQDQVARQLGASRSTIAQMELGNRAVTSLELERLAFIYARSITDFLAEVFDDTDALVVLFRVDKEMADNPKLNQVLRHCVTLCLETTNLERHLGLFDRQVLPVLYPLPAPSGKWEAIQQGDRIASLERRRLNLGHASLWDIVQVLEPQGVRCADVSMPEDISGLFMANDDIGLCVVVNSKQHPRRRSFSYAHEYAHLLLDRSRRGNVSRRRNRDDLAEVRANAFAASFLMPADAVRDHMHNIGKGLESRSLATAFDETEVVVAQHRTLPHSQEVQLYDIVQLAHHFGVSTETAVHRLRNLRILSDDEKDGLLKKKEEAKAIRTALDRKSAREHPRARDPFEHHFIRLALETYRRELITCRKLAELAKLIKLSAEELQALLKRAGLDDSVEMGPEDIRIPA